MIQIPSKNSLILHGHFYQPPREDPWTGLIPKQASAAPFHDWNRRITKECYGANAASRMLDPKGRIINIMNNYQYLSFNIGPTLMEWLFTQARKVYENILDADAISVKKHKGHGNAIAQSFNHTILPLDTREDKKTQIKWGLSNFERHFGRKSEGIWLPEAAVDEETLDILADEGIAFLILSPWQAAAHTVNNGKAWKQVGDSPIESNKAYKLERDKGSLSVFFYNGILAQGISFNHFLHNAENLFRSLMNYHDPENSANLISAATDGEIYGHHEAFGDMCIATLADLVNNSDTLCFSNFGLYLEEHPPRELVKLKEGEDGMGTSWSCFHGVSRWRKNCGCSTGGMEGWNQEWRTPLRNALSGLRDICIKLYINEVKALGASQDPYTIRNGYVKVINGETNASDYAAACLPKGASPSDRTRLLRLLEGQKYSMFMFTSCGWFFAELSGLEPMQNMRYALKVIEYYQSLTQKNLLETFLGNLSTAQSNIPGMGTGRDIFQRLIMPDKKDLYYPAAVFAATACIGNGFLHERYGIYRQTGLEITAINSGEQALACSGTLSVEDTTILDGETFNFTISETSDGMEFLIEPMENGSERGNESAKSRSMDIEELPDTIIDACVKAFAEKGKQRAAGFGVQLFADANRVLAFSDKLKTKPHIIAIKAAELAANSLLEDLLHDPENLLSRENMDKLHNLLVLVRRFTLLIDEAAIQRSLTHCLTLLMDIIAGDLLSDRVEDLGYLLSVVRKGGIEPDLTISQNILFPLLKGKAAEYRNVLYEGKKDSIIELKHLIKLGSILGFNVEDLKEVLLG